MISKDSWIRVNPVLLDHEQSLFLDGVRFAAQAAELAFGRLKKTLQLLALQSEPDDEKLIVSAVHDAWSLIDSLNRLRGLMRSPPKFGQKRPSEVQVFLDATEDLRELRNQAQHLEGRLSQIAKRSDSVWGKIRWITWIEEDGRRRVFTCTLIAGTVRSERSGRLEIPAFIPRDHETEEIALHAAGRAVRLDSAMESARQMIQWLEVVLERHFRPLEGKVPNTVPDVVAIMELDVDELKKIRGAGDDKLQR